MKETWINLELYFESYEFSNFLGLFWNCSKFLINFSKDFQNFLKRTDDVARSDRPIASQSNDQRKK